MYIYYMLNSMYSNDHFRKVLDERPVSVSAMEEIIEERLSEREKKAIYLRYDKKLSYRAIGEEIGVSGSRTAQICNKAECKLIEGIMRRCMNVQKLIKDNEMLQFQHSILKITYDDLYKKYVNVCNKEDPGHISYEDVPDIPIDDLELSVRTYNCLKRAGYNTVRDLYGVTTSELIKIRNFGNVCLNEVIDKVKPYGIVFSE